MAGPIGPKFGTHLQIHLGMDIRQINCPSRHKGAPSGGGGLGVNHSKILGSCQMAGPIGTNFGSRLRIHLGMNTAKSKSPLNTTGGISRGWLGDHKLKCLGKLSNGWSDWHQIWHKSADSSGNRHRLNTIRPSIPQGVLGGHMGKLSNNWTDWHQIWYTSADSSGSGHRLNTIRPSISQGAFWGVLGGRKFKILLKLSNGWTDWHQIWHTCADSNKLPFETQGGQLRVYGVKHSKVLRSCQRLDRLAPTVVHVCGFIWEWT